MNEKKRHYQKPPAKVRSVQQAMPNAKVYESGMMEFKGHLYSMTYQLEDVDFATGSEEDQHAFVKAYMDILNSLEGFNCSVKLTLFNRNINQRRIHYKVLGTHENDGYDKYREEYNSIRQHNAMASGGMIQDKFITVTVERQSVEIAAEFFVDFIKNFNKKLERLHSKITQLDAEERMRIFWDFYRCGEEKRYSFDLAAATKRRTSWKDYVSPAYLRFRSKDFDVHKKVGRVCFLSDWGKGLRINFLSQITSLRTNMMVSVDMIPLSVETRNRWLEDAEMAAESNRDRWERRPGAENRRYAQPPMRIKKDQQIVQTIAYDIEERNQQLFLSNVTVVLLADTIMELDKLTDSLESAAGDCGGKMDVKGLEQLAGLNTVLPYGPRFIQNLRDVTTENQAVMMPFSTIAIYHPDGIPYGVQKDTRREIMIDRRLLHNGNEWVLGVSGSGKSFLVELISFYEVLITPGDVIFVDPHGEYAHITKALGGQVVSLGSTSGHVINAMDMCVGFGAGEVDDIRKKMDSLVAIFHSTFGNDFTRQMDSILMRCAQRVYRKYQQDVYAYQNQIIQPDGSQPPAPVMPTLSMLYYEVRAQQEEVAQNLALLMEQMIDGPMSCFNGWTNVNMDARVLCFDISKMDKSVHDAGMTLIMDTIRNRLITNFNINKPTYIKIDEVGRFLDDMYLSRLFESFYAEVRKFGGYITGIVQNANKLLHSEAGRNMLSNSEIVVMLRQSDYDADTLQTLLGLSDIQRNYLVEAEEGCGMIKSGNQYIMYDGRIEKGNIYEMADTKPKHNYS